jgi:tetratricopeptide (TPR) repeat protein
VVETPNPLRLDARLLAFGPQDQSFDRDDYAYDYYPGMVRRRPTPVYRDDLATAASLASQLGVTMQPRVGPEDISIGKVRMAYQQHGLHADAARLLKREADEAPHPRERGELLAAMARELHLAGKPNEARKAATDAETLLLADANQFPSSEAYLNLHDLYISRAFGPDYAKAWETLSSARSLNNKCDPSGAKAVHCLYRLGKHQEAVAEWRRALREGQEGAFGPESLAFAALAACKARDPAGPGLARQVLFRYPAHTMAAEIRELIK